MLRRYKKGKERCRALHLIFLEASLHYLHEYNHTHTHGMHYYRNERTHIRRLPSISKASCNFLFTRLHYCFIGKKIITCDVRQKREKGREKYGERRKEGAAKKESNRKERRICLCSSSFNVSAWVINEHMNGRNCLHLF